MGKKILMGFGALLALMLIAMVVLAISFDVNRYKPDIVKYVSDHYGRTLKIDGDLSLGFFPAIAISMPATSLSERDGEQPAASVREARVSVRLLPLLRGAFEANILRIDGLKARVVRQANGKLSIDDLLGSGDKSAGQNAGSKTGSTGPMALDIGGVRIRDAQLSYLDEASGRTLLLDELNLETGRITNHSVTPVKLSFVLRTDQPRSEALVTLTGNANIDMASGTYSARALQASIKAALTLDAQQSLNATIEATGIDVSVDELDIASIAFHSDVRQPARRIETRLSGAVSGKLKARVFEAARLTGQTIIEDANAPGGKIELPLELSLRSNLAREFLNLGARTSLDGSAIEAKLSYRDFSRPSISFDMQADTLDLDRLFPAAPAPAASDKDVAAKSSQAQAEAGLDLSALNALRGGGQIRVGKLRMRGLEASALKATLKFADGRLDVAPLNAQLYGGALKAQASIHAMDNHIALNADLSNIAINPLLVALSGTAPLDGRGTVKLDVRGTGAKPSAIQRSLVGSASLALADGAIRGFDLGEMLNRGKSLLGKGKTEQGAADASKKTEFSSLAVSFAIADGIARSTDLDMRSPLLRVGGEGSLDLGASQMDYTVKPSLVASSQGQGGRGRDELLGLTVPVKLSGPLGAPAWAIDWAGAGKALLKSRAGEQIKEKLAPKVDELKLKRDEAKQDMKEKAGDKLRGLLKR